MTGFLTFSQVRTKAVFRFRSLGLQLTQSHWAMFIIKCKMVPAMISLIKILLASILPSPQLRTYCGLQVHTEECRF